MRATRSSPEKQFRISEVVTGGWCREGLPLGTCQWVAELAAAQLVKRSSWCESFLLLSTVDGAGRDCPPAVVIGLLN